jgi:hypothetical protein
MSSLISEQLIKSSKTDHSSTWSPEAPKLRPYQTAGIKRLATSRHATISDESGLGKRAQIIVALKRQRATGHAVLPVLILCRQGWETYWQNEWRKWAGTGALIIDREQYDSWQVDLVSNEAIEAVICTPEHLRRMLALGDTKGEMNSHQAILVPLRIRVFQSLVEDLTGGPLHINDDEMMRRLTRWMARHYEIVTIGSYPSDCKHEEIYRSRQEVADQLPAVQLSSWPASGTILPEDLRETTAVRYFQAYAQDILRRQFPHIFLYRDSDYMEVRRQEAIRAKTLLIRAGSSEEERQKTVSEMQDCRWVVFWHIDNPPTTKDCKNLEAMGCKFTSLLPAEKTEAALQNWGRITCTVFV